MKKFMTVVAATALLVGCAGSNDDSADFNASDTMFAQMMIPHHEQAIEMSDIALDPATSAGDTVRDLASRIKAEQDPEIAQMTGLLTNWGQPTQMDSSMDHSSMMSGMLTADELTSLGGLRGDEFDVQWLKAMIKHHEGAIDMARDVLKSGKNKEIRTLAESVVNSQQAEIDEMRAIVGD